MGKSVLQEWVRGLTLMQQSVLITATRGPDNIRKDHVVKVLLRWYRRCFLLSAFEGRVITDPYEEGGGSFTGPLKEGNIDDYVDLYLRHIDELPHHFQLHLMHAAEILGYKHPDPNTRSWWNYLYTTIVMDAHLHVETEEEMDYRLGDNREQWRAKEGAVAR